MSMQLIELFLVCITVSITVANRKLKIFQLHSILVHSLDSVAYLVVASNFRGP